MAYPAVVSLNNTIRRLLNSSIVYSTEKLLQSAHMEVKSLLQALKRLDTSSRRSNRLNELDEQIREAAQKLESSLEFHDSDLEIEQVMEEINSFSEKAKRLEEEFIEELGRARSTEEGDTVVAPSSRDFGVEMVGFTDEISGMKKKLLGVVRPDDYGVFWIVGRAGTGRTVAARIILEDLCVGRERCVDCGAWVTIGPTYQWKQIILAILRQLGHPAAGDSPSDQIKVPLLMFSNFHAVLSFFASMQLSTC